MDLDAIHRLGVIAELSIAAIAFPLLFWITVPYGGRHTSERWGPTLPSWLAWLLMEAPAPIAFVVAYLRGAHAGELVPLLFAAAFLGHYLERAFLQPLRMRASGKRTPLLSAGIAAAVNVLNGTLQAQAVAAVHDYGTAWLLDPRFAIGAAVFLAGAALNRYSDAILRGLRRPGETGYRIPTGGAYRWVSSPNYLGEIVQWGGWALATASMAGLAFFVLTIANLVPRARANHRWYREHFADHPPERRALVPYLW